MKLFSTLSCWLAVAGLVPGSALAEVKQSPAYNQCMAAADGVTVAMLDCISAELTIQDRQLNANYRALMSKLGPAEKDRLRTQQRAWIRDRDKQCKPEGDGTLDLVNSNDCVLTETTRQAGALRDWR